MAPKSQLAADPQPVDQPFGRGGCENCSSRTDWTSAHELTLADQIQAALALAREVRALLADQIVPALPPEKRSFALSLAAGLSRSDIINEKVVTDLEAFAGFINQQVELGRKIGWEADECHVDGGYATSDYDERSRELMVIFPALYTLQSSVAIILDHTRAQAIAMSLQ